MVAKTRETLTELSKASFESPRFSLCRHRAIDTMVTTFNVNMTNPGEVV